MPINIFGFELGRRRTAKTIPQLSSADQPVKSFIPPDFEDGASVVDFVGGYGFGVQMLNYDLVYRSDGEQIIKYRQMHDHAEIQTAVDDIVTQAIVLNEKTNTLNLNLDKSSIPVATKKKINAEFEEILRLMQFNTRGAELFRKWYIDGRLYIQILMDEKKQRKGIAELRVIDPIKIQKVRNIEREVGDNGVKFIKRIQEYYLYSADDFVGNGRDTINYRYSSEGIILPNDSVAYANSGFIDPGTKRVMGHLHKAIKPLNQLRMLEDSIVIYRISRAPERRIFYIDVGSLPKNKSEQYLRDIMNRYRNKLVYDTTTGEMRDEKRHLSMLEDFWMPRREGGKGTEVQTLPGGQNLGELQDVDYFLRKLYISLHVPPSRFKDDAGFNMGKAAEITRDEVRFTKFVNRLQSKFSEIFMQLLRVQLIAKNILTEDEWKEYSYDFTFDFAKDSYFSELKENEMTMTRLLTLREVDPYMGKFFSKDWVNKNILQMTDDSIKKMKSEMEADAAEAAAQQPPMGMEGEMPGDQSMVPQGAFGAPVGQSEIEPQDVGMDDIESELGLEDIPEIEGIFADEESGTGGTGGVVKDSVDHMISSFDDFYHPVEGRSVPQIILENKNNPFITLSKSNISPFGKKILKNTLNRVN